MKVKDARFIKGAVAWEHLPCDGRPEVAVAGRSNVGKSALINRLLGRKNLARTSGQPGKTREFNYYLVGERFYLVDLPGYGFAKTSKKERARWAAFIEEYLAEREPLRAAVHLIDSRHPPTDLDRGMTAAMLGQRVPYVVALTKADKLSGNERPASRQRVRQMLRQEFGLEAPVVLTSARTGRGKDELLRWIDDLV